MPTKTMSAGQWSQLVLVAAIWGTSFFLIEIALRDLGPFTLVFYRLLLAAAVSVAVLYLNGARLPLDGASWRRFFMLGAFNTSIPFMLISSGQVYINSSQASILNATVPVFTVLMAHFLTKDEKMTRQRLAGVLVSLAGVCLLVGPDAFAGLSSSFLGQAAVLGGAMSYAYAGVYARRFDEIPILQAMAGTLVAASLLSIPFAFIFEYPLVTDLSPATMGAIVFMALLATAFSYLVYFHVIRTAGATNTLLVVFLVPVTAILLGVIFLGESINARMTCAVFIVFSGLILVDGRLLRRMMK